MDEITQGLTLRIPEGILEHAEDDVKKRLFRNKSEALVDYMRNGIRLKLYSISDIKTLQTEN